MCHVITNLGVEVDDGDGDERLRVGRRSDGCVVSAAAARASRRQRPPACAAAPLRVEVDDAAHRVHRRRARRCRRGVVVVDYDSPLSPLSPTLSRRVVRRTGRDWTFEEWRADGLGLETRIVDLDRDTPHPPAHQLHPDHALPVPRSPAPCVPVAGDITAHVILREQLAPARNDTRASWFGCLLSLCRDAV